MCVKSLHAEEVVFTNVPWIQVLTCPPVGESNHCRSCDGKNIGRFLIADITAQLKVKFKGECIPNNKQGMVDLKDGYKLQDMHLN